MNRGEVYLADLNPGRGSEQAGIRPVILVQRDTLLLDKIHVGRGYPFGHR